MEELKDKIEEIIGKVKNDPTFATRFQEEPVKVVEEVMGVDLPDDKINEIITTIKAKIKLDDSGVLGKIKGLFD